MASKRRTEEEGEGESEGNDNRDLQVPSKRRQGFGNPPKQTETRSAAAAEEIALCLKPVVRELMQEVMQQLTKQTLLQSNLYPCSGLSTLNQQQTGKSGGGGALQLCFVNKLPPMIYTLRSIKAEDGAPLQIELRDAANQNRRVRDLIKIRICVLDGYFGCDENEDWSAEEFNAQTLSPREGKGPLLSGQPIVTLKNGVGCITNRIVFTDNSSWTKSKTFRLGVKVLKSNSIGAAEIREGRSEPFKVKDNRGQAYKKHERPSLSDEVWRLKKISKGGKVHKQLHSHEIKTVKDLLRLHTTNPAALREKMGDIPRRSWDAIIEHARGCMINGDEQYIYEAAEESISLFFNCVYVVVGAIFNGECYRSIQSLNPEEERLVERVKQQAYNNLKELKPVEATTHGLLKTPSGLQTAPYGDPARLIGQAGVRPSSSTTVMDGASESEFEDSTDGSKLSDDFLSSSFLDPWDSSMFPPDSNHGDGSDSSNHSTSRRL